MQKINSSTIQEIQALRQTGYSVPEISKVVKVSKTSILRYIKNVEILPEFVSAWSLKRGGSRKRRLQREEIALKEAKELVGENLTLKEKLLYICALYWAEGNKKDFILTNTVPNLIKTFVEGLKQVFNIDSDRIQVSIRIYENLDRQQCLDFWSNIVGIPTNKFVNVHTLVGKKIGKLEYGMCRIRVIKGSDLLKKVMAVNLIVTNLLPL